MASYLPQANSEMGKFSGIKGDKIRYFRAVANCADRVAVFELDYSRDQKIPYDPIVVRMVRSLRAEGC